MTETPLPPITIGTPLLPDPAKLAPLMDSIWQRGQLTNSGPLHDRLETELATDLGVGCARLTGSGTQALMLALLLGRVRGHLPPGAQVITTPLSFAASAGVIAALGLVPVFADVDPDRLTLAPDAAARAITPRTGAILSVHLYGAVADHSALAALARDRGLWLIHDAAHAYGVTLDGGGVGNLGDITAFSLHATKLLNTAEGGIVTTADPETGQTLSRLRNFGLDGRAPVMPGINAKLSEPHAAIGLALRERARAEASARLALRDRLDALFDAHAAFARPALHPDQSRPALFYPLALPDRERRDRFLAAMAENGIFARAYFPLLCGPGRPWPMADVPHAAAAADRVFCLPFHSGVTEAHLDRIATLAERV